VRPSQQGSALSQSCDKQVLRYLRFITLSDTAIFADFLAESMESKLFDIVRYNTDHVLHQLVPPEKDIHYNLRQ